MMGEILGALYLLCMMFYAGVLLQHTVWEDRNWFGKIFYCLLALFFVVPLAPFAMGYDRAVNSQKVLDRLESLEEQLKATSRITDLQ